MEEYKKDVVYARKNKIDKRFANSIIEHARILTKEIILDAKSNIKILSDSFNEYFYSSLKKEIEDFLSKDNTSIHVIVAKGHEENKLLKYFQNKFPSKFKINFIEHDKFPKDNDTKEYVNYIVNDNKAFRYEYSDKEIHNGHVNAIANFNNEKDSNFLNDFFKKIIPN